MTDVDPLEPMATYEEAYPEPPSSNGAEPGPDLLAGLRNGAWLDAQDFPPLTYHVPGVLPEGSTLLVGPPKSGKSWLSLTVALAVAAGGRVLSQEVQQRPVLLLALEDGDRRLQDRCRTLLADDGIPPGLSYLTSITPGTVLATIQTWLDLHPGAEPLVILDTLGRVMPPALLGESSYQRDYRVGAALKRLTDDRPGSCLLICHHDRKAGSEDFVERVSGTNGLAGSADTIVVLARARHEASGSLAVTGRDVAEGEYAITFDGGRGLWSLDGPDLATAAARATQRRMGEGVGDRSRDVIAYVTEQPEGTRAAQVAAAIGIDEGQARQYLGRLAESGRLIRLARGLYGGVASVASSRSHPPDHPHAPQPHDLYPQRDNATDATPLQLGEEDGDRP